MDWRTETSMMSRSGNSGRRVGDESRVKARQSMGGVESRCCLLAV